MTWWARLAEPIDGLDDTLTVVSGFDDALARGLLRPSRESVEALHALAAAVSASPLAGLVAVAVDKVIAGSLSEDHLVALAAARSALFGAAHDALLARFDTLTGRTRSAWAAPTGAAAATAPNLLAASRSWLADLAMAGWRGIDHDLAAQSSQAVQALLGDVRARRLAVLLDGLATELRASCPGVTMPRVPVRRWADLWSRAELLSQPGAADPAPRETISGRLLPLGLDLHEYATAVQAQLHAVLEPSGDGPSRLVRASVSAAKTDTIVGVGVWQLLRPHASFLAAAGGQRSIDIADMPITDAGDLVWRDGKARLGAPADAFATARVRLADAVAAASPPLERHPARIAEPVLLEDYAAVAHGGGVTFTFCGTNIEADVDRLPSAGPLTARQVAASTACLGLMRWDAGRWTVQPLAVEGRVKQKVVTTHVGGWAGGASDAAGKKAETAAGGAVAVLRERAGRLLRA